MRLSVSNSDLFCFQIGKSYYLQTLLRECKYKIKEKVIKSFVEDYWKSSSDGDEDDYEEEKKE